MSEETSGIRSANVRVTSAVLRAERMERDGEAGAVAAFAEAADAEEELARLHAAGTLEGAVARVGAIRACVKSGQRERAGALAARYLADPELAAQRHEEIRALLRPPSPADRSPAEELCRALLVGALLRGLRERGGFSQSHLATDLGVSQTTVARFERGAESPTAKSLATMASRLGLHPGELFGLVERCWSRMASASRGLLGLAADAPWHEAVLDASGPDGAGGAARFAVEVVLIEDGRGPAPGRRPRTSAGH